ncbi:zinc protease-like protein [Scenedesmus sp. PABB004]|nr:zinc protease-like protein [Scenedesmus sp. PABB004]
MRATGVRRSGGAAAAPALPQQRAAAGLLAALQLLAVPGAPAVALPHPLQLQDQQQQAQQPQAQQRQARPQQRPAPELDISGPGGLPAIYRRLPPLPATFPPLPRLAQPAIVSRALANGLKVFLVVDREVPLTRGSLLIPGGQASSPAGKVGLASIAAALQRAGGSVDHPAEALDARLEDLAAAIEASAGQQSTTLDFQCMTRDAPELLRLLSELLREPALPPDKLALLQGQVSNVIRHRDDSAAGVARRELAKLIYGADSIYARTPTLRGVAGLTRDDVAAHIAAWQRPDAAVLGLVGDFDPEEMMAAVEQALGGWAPAPGQPAQPRARPREELRDLPAVLSAAQAAAAPPQGAAAAPQLVRLVDRPGAGQAAVFAGERGVSLGDPDVYALDVLASRLNGFGGLVFDTLRTRKGLAYSVQASWDSPVDHRGLFVAAAETAQPARFVQELARVLAEARSAPPSRAELARAKAGLLQTVVFNFASTETQLQRALVYELLGLPQDFLFTYRDRVEAVTADDVAAAAARHLHPAQQVVVVVGDAGALRPQLEAAGFRVEALRPEPAD